MIRRCGAIYGFVFLLAFLTVAGWSCSALCALRCEWIALAPGLAGALWLAWRIAGSWRELGRQTAEPFAYWPFLLVAGAVLLICAIYPPAMHDSLSYRLPRMLFWNQAGRVYYIPTADDRLNFLSHVWCLCTLPLVQLIGIKAARFWNCAGWFACQMIFYAWALAWCGSRHRARQLSFLASTSTFALLQASSTANDLLAATSILACLYFITLYETQRTPSSICWSALALGLAAGVKPHFATLGLPFALWFFLARSRPWRAFKWRWAPALALLLAFCSPIPSFALNLKYYGSVIGPATEKSYAGRGPLTNLGFGSGMLAWQTLQPCVNPLGLVLDKRLDNWVHESGLRDVAPRFALRMQPVCVVDNASLGLATTLLTAVGIWLAFRRKLELASSWPRWALLAGSFGLLAALSKVLPTNVGRSSAGFIYLFLPLALVGWTAFSPRVIRGWVALCLAGSLTALAVCPEHPLWPVSWVRSLAERSGAAGLAKKLEFYQSFSERKSAGTDLLKAVPANETRVVALVAAARPLLPLLWPPHHFNIQLMDDDATLAQFKAMNANTILVSGAAGLAFPEICDYVQHSGQFECVSSHSYVSNLADGPEVWSLYCRKQNGVSRQTSASPPAD